METLTIDIGNSCAKLVAFNGCEPVEEVWMCYDNIEILATFCSKHAFSQGIYSTVIPIDDPLAAAISALPFPMTRLIPGVTPVPVINRYVTPATLGADRLAAAVGAYIESGGGRDILIIDTGTCITYDFVNAAGEYLGGNISPGPTIRLKALNTFTASLPLVSRHGEAPNIGNSTETAIRSGVLKGIKYEIEGYIDAYITKYPNVLVYLTGGTGDDLHISEKKCIFADKLLVPKGLNYILQKLIENGKQ